MGLLPTTDDITQLGEQIKTANQLADATAVAKILASDTVFATIASSAEVTGPLKQKFESTVNHKVEAWSWEGIDEQNLQVGYLSHNGSQLRFQTKDSTIFDLPFTGLKIESHGLGLLITTPVKQYVIGNYMAVNELLSPSSKMKYTFGSESTIWMRELGNLGVIDKESWQKSRSRSKWFMFLWMLLVIALSIWVLTLKK